MLVPVCYVISYEQRSLSRGEKWRALFQDHTDKLILSEKKSIGNQSGHGNNLLLRLSFCDAYDTMTCSNAKDNILCNHLFTIAAKRSTFLGFTGCDTIPKENDSFF